MAGREIGRQAKNKMLFSLILLRPARFGGARAVVK